MSSALPTAFRPSDFFRFLIGSAMFAMLAMILIQEFCGAATTWLIIMIARDISEENISAGHFGWIVVAQTISYLAGAVSWIFAERAGFGAYSRYMLYFARQNRFQTALPLPCRFLPRLLRTDLICAFSSSYCSTRWCSGLRSTPVCRWPLPLPSSFWPPCNGFCAHRWRRPICTTSA